MISMPSLILILVIVILLFGTKKLKNIGSDLGGALKGFKKAVNDGEKENQEKNDKLDQKGNGTIIEGEVIKEETKEKNKSE